MTLTPAIAIFGSMVLITVVLLDEYNVGTEDVEGRIKIMDPVFLGQVLTSIPFSWAVFFLTGLFRRYCHMKANYTRKINMMVSISMGISQRLCLKDKYIETMYTMIFPFVLYFMALILCFVDEMQEMDTERSSLFGTNKKYVLLAKRCIKYFVVTMKMGFERPEDVPYTVRWTVAQYIAFCLVALPFMYIFAVTMQRQSLLLIPMIISSFGDGLAEVVGVYYSTPSTRYSVPAWLYPGRSPFVRSYQGSMCVFFSALVSIVIVARIADPTELTPPQLLFLFLALPPIATLSEALAPHSLDDPFLFVATCCTVLMALLI